MNAVSATSTALRLEDQPAKVLCASIRWIDRRHPSGTTEPVTMSIAKVTVGIPTFNRAGWLREAVESVLAQTFTNFRLIVRDNASDDATPDVVRSFSDERIQYVRSERNVGAIGNLNRLAALADTEFLVLLPDDDKLYPGYLRAAVDLLDRFETVGLVHSAYDFIDERSRVIRRVHPVASRSHASIMKHDRALEWMMAFRSGPQFSTIMYRTKAIVEAGGLREEEEPFGDLELWMRIALNWDFGYIAKPLAGFREHAQTRTRTITAEDAVTFDERSRVFLYSQIKFQRRMHFLDEAQLASPTTKRFRALATLQLLVETAALGLPWNEAAARLAKLVRTYPRILLRPALWRLVIAQLGGRRTRSALSGALTRHRRALGKAE
jgi:glycosyltransferase involved in cell wall biosynthesis